ncbi:MAG: AfsR/SARP family transcriptional regulator [Euzebyaceae bacterium]|nr:AfsR/SARP family transcriptional regulator [Euzebyaceae bacterium]
MAVGYDRPHSARQHAAQRPGVRGTGGARRVQAPRALGSGGRDAPHRCRAAQAPRAARRPAPEREPGRLAGPARRRALGRRRAGQRGGQRAHLRLAAAAHAGARRRGLALWRGAALGELASEPFAHLAAARLEEARLTAVEGRVEAGLALGQHAALVGELEALVAEHPLREALRAKLMLAMYRSGRQADALAAYQQLRRILDRELGLEPSPELHRLEEAILLQKIRTRLGAAGRGAGRRAPGRRPARTDDRSGRPRPRAR